MGRQHDDGNETGRLVVGLPQHFKKRTAVHRLHFPVADNEIGLADLDLGQGFCAIGRLTDVANLKGFQDRVNQAPHVEIVINDQHIKRAELTPIGVAVLCRDGLRAQCRPQSLKQIVICLAFTKKTKRSCPILLRAKPF